MRHHVRTVPSGVCNTACFLASRLGRTEVTQADLVAAVEQTKYGRVYEAGRFISPGRKQRFAVVESGFCLAAALLPAIEPIDYVTILPSIKSTVGRTVLKVRLLVTRCTLLCCSVHRHRALSAVLLHLGVKTLLM
jgi:hypothetical protein